MTLSNKVYDTLKWVVIIGTAHKCNKRCYTYSRGVVWEQFKGVTHE